MTHQNHGYDDHTGNKPPANSWRMPTSYQHSATQNPEEAARRKAAKQQALAGITGGALVGGMGDYIKKVLGKSC